MLGSSFGIIHATAYSSQELLSRLCSPHQVPGNGEYEEQAY